MPKALQERLDALRDALTQRAARAGLDLRGPAPPARLALAPSAVDWVETALRALAEAACLRAERAGRGGALELAVGAVDTAGARRLRVLAVDRLPGLPAAAQGSAFAYLGDAAGPPEPDPLGLTALRRAAAPADLDFLSGAGENLLWTELTTSAEPVVALPGWSRRPRLDAADLLRRLGGDQRIATMVVSTFRADAPRQLAALEAALPDHHAEALRLAHSLKGAARNVGGLMLGEVAAGAEAALQSGQPGRAAACLPRLGWELERLEAAWSAGSA